MIEKMDKAEVKEFVKGLSPALRPKIAIVLAEVEAEEAEEAARAAAEAAEKEALKKLMTVNIDDFDESCQQQLRSRIQETFLNTLYQFVNINEDRKNQLLLDDSRREERFDMLVQSFSVDGYCRMAQDAMDKTFQSLRDNFKDVFLYQFYAVSPSLTSRSGNCPGESKTDLPISQVPPHSASDKKGKEGTEEEEEEEEEEGGKEEQEKEEHLRFTSPSAKKRPVIALGSGSVKRGRGRPPKNKEKHR